MKSHHLHRFVVFCLVLFAERCGCTPLKAKVKLRKTIKTAEVHRQSQMLRFPVELENSCQSSGSKFYSWTVSKIDKETGLFGPLLKLGKKKGSFYLYV